jgi:hypothetical protein
MAFSVLEKTMVAAKDIDSLNRSAKSAAVMENGMVGQLTTQDADNVWTMIAPATAALTNLWMVHDSDNVVVKDSVGNEYKGLTQNPQNFSIKIGKVFDVFKPQLEDILTLSEDGVGGTQAANTFAVATDAQFKLQWAAAAVAGLSLELVNDDARLHLAAVTSGSSFPPNPYTAANKFKVVAI